MKYVLLISHGTVASALHETLNAFFLGSRSDLLSLTMSEGMGSDEFTQQARQVLNRVNRTDEIIVLADILGGSPLTYTSYMKNRQLAILRQDLWKTETLCLSLPAAQRWNSSDRSTRNFTCLF